MQIDTCGAGGNAKAQQGTEKTQQRDTKYANGTPWCQRMNIDRSKLMGRVTVDDKKKQIKMCRCQQRRRDEIDKKLFKSHFGDVEHFRLSALEGAGKASDLLKTSVKATPTKNWA